MLFPEEKTRPYVPLVIQTKENKKPHLGFAHPTILLVAAFIKSTVCELKGT